MNLLQIPILDEFHVADPVQAKKRGSDFAAQKGLLSSAFGGRRGGTLPSPLPPDAEGDGDAQAPAYFDVIVEPPLAEAAAPA